MIRRFTIAGLIMFCMAAFPSLAGTWSDGFEDGNLVGSTMNDGGEWEIQDSKLSFW